MIYEAKQREWETQLSRFNIITIIIAIKITTLGLGVTPIWVEAKLLLDGFGEHVTGAN